MRMIRLLLLVILAAVTAACATPNPIVTGDPVDFRHRSGVFSLQAPKDWQPSQSEVETEALASFTEPEERALLIGYAGLLDRRLPDAEGLKIVSDLTLTLLGVSNDYQVISQQRRPDGAFEVSFSLTNRDQKWEGQSIFRDTDLALSGVIAAGEEKTWAETHAALQPYIDSFQVNAESVQGTYFKALEGGAWAMAVPLDWPQQIRPGGAQITARNGRMSILVAQAELAQPLDDAGLTSQAVAALGQFGINAQVAASARLPDGRLKVMLERSDRRIIGYLEQGNSTFVGLFFNVPADRVQDYQAFIDFEYSVFVTFLS
ncbi:MAG TPA: hypothetical protein VJG32_20010 [Anaerolineae bacterium]|nr:hypothetical protein [Anaerolineae bacterium]